MTATIADVLTIAERVARDVARWTGADADDLIGALCDELGRRAADYVALLDEGKAATAEGWLRNKAGEAAQRERIRIQRELGQYHYDPEYVRLFLPFLFNRQDWANGAKVLTERPETWATGEAIDTAIDACSAWPRLRDWQAAIIVARHLTCRPTGDGPDWVAIAAATGRASADAAEKAYQRATLALAVEMNGNRANRVADHDGPGSRRAVSNAAARALLSDTSDMEMRRTRTGGMGEW